MGKRSKQTVGYRYYIGMHMVLCAGPIDQINWIKVGSKLAWSGPTTGGGIVVDNVGLFGGEDSEGGVKGAVGFNFGSPAQGQDSYLVSQLGSLVPAYRTVVSAVLISGYVGTTQYLKPWSFRGQRIHVRQIGGIAQWYDAVSQIPDVSVPAVETLLTADTAWPANGSSLDGTDAHITYALLPGESLRVTKVPGMTYDSWSIVPYDAHDPTNGNGWTNRWGAKDASGTISVYWPTIFVSGTETDAYNAVVNTSVVLSGSSSFTLFPWDATIDDNRNGLSLKVYKVSYPQSQDMNPIHIIRECLTDPDWGLGYQDSDIDDTFFMPAANTLYSEGLGMSLLWDEQSKLEDFVNQVIMHIDAALYVSRVTGKFVIKLIRNDYDVSTLLHFNESNIIKVANPTRPAFGDLVNTVTVQFNNSNGGVGDSSDSVTVTDPASVQMQGGGVPATIQYMGFSNARNATIAAQRDLRSLSSSFLNCTIYVDQTAKDLNLGDVFLFSWARWGVSNLVMRITGIAFGDGKSNVIRITCAEDVFDTPSTAVVIPAGTAWVDPSSPPTPATYHMAIEAPYYEIVQQYGQTQVDSNLTSRPEAGYVIAVAGRPSTALNARVWTDDGSGYTDQAALDFCAIATLGVSIGATDTLLHYTAGQALDIVATGTYLQLDNELMRIDSIDTIGLTFTVGRGVLDAVPISHTAGGEFFFWDTYQGVVTTEYASGEAISVKILPVNGSGTVALADAATDIVTLAQRAYRPYPPGNLKVNGVSYPTVQQDGVLTVSWAHRDRTQETSATLYDYTHGDIGPEVGTTYRLQGYINGVLVHTDEPISGTSTTWVPGSSGAVTVEVHSKRDGVYSLYAPSHTFGYGTFDRVTETGEFRTIDDGSNRTTED